MHCYDVARVFIRLIFNCLTVIYYRQAHWFEERKLFDHLLHFLFFSYLPIAAN